MKQTNGRRNGLPRRILAALGTMALLIGLGLGVSRLLPVVKTPEQIRAEKLEILRNAENGFSQETIVLRNVSLDRAQTLADKLRARMRSTIRGDFTVLYLPEGVTIWDVYEDDSNLEYVSELEPDYYAYTGAVSATGQELLTTQPEYEVTDPLFDLTTQLEYVRMGTVWEQTRGSGVTVAIIDTGIDTDHPEFEGRISEASYNASEDKTVRDYGLEMIEDEVGHGTAVAGVLGAAMNNGTGITGVAPEVELLIIKCEGTADGTFARSSDLVFGLAYAIECDVDVVNMSFGMPTNPFSAYTQLALDSDIICVAAAGNSGSSLEMYPAADPNVIGVGAMEPETWALADYSNYGDNSDLLAPGTVYTTDLDGGYSVRTGTSVASPMVAGAVALYLAENPYQELSDIRAVLEASSVDLGSRGEDWVNGFGALDVCAMVVDPKGTITYDMLTDEVKGQTQIFVEGRTVQVMPEPERENVAFDGWYFDAQCTDECEYFTDVFSQDVTLYASWINEDDGTAYIYTVLDDGTAEIQSYTGKRRYLTVPDQIEGYTVTSLGEQVFAGNSRLRSVKLPATLTNIGTRAFYNCTSLLNIEIPEAVRNIGEEAFTHCVRLRTVGIAPGGALKTIGDFAFSNCGISSMDLPVNLEEVGEGFLLGCGIRAVTVAEGNTSFTLRSQALCDIKGEKLIYYPSALTGDYAVPESVKTLGIYAFYGSRLSGVELPDGLVSIEKSCFQNSAVTAVTLPASVTILGDSVWQNCRSLSQVDLSGASGIAALPAHCFASCATLQEITIPDWFQSLGSSAFAFSGLEQIHFGAESRLTGIGSGIFSNTPLEQICVPTGVTAIPNAAFNRCVSLKTVTFAEGSALRSIESAAFQRCSSLTSITFPESMTAVQRLAFYESGLTSLWLGENVTSLGAGAFAACRDLPSIGVDEANTAYTAVDGILFTANGSVLVTFPAGRGGSYALPDTVTKIADYGFSCAAKLTDVTLNEGLTQVGGYAFENCASMQTPVLPETLTTVGEYAFSGCTAMSDPLLIPKNVISLGRYAFLQDYALTTITVAEDSALSRIGYGTFANCGITDFRIPVSVTAMGQDVFSGCRKLERVTFAAGCKLENLAAWTFRGTTVLKELVFEEGCALKHIEARALEQIASLERVNLESCTALEIINNYAFQSCSGLTEINLPATVKEIGRYAFSGCTSLAEITIPAGTEFIGRYAFAGTNQLKVYFEAPVLPLYLQEYWDYGIYGFYLGTSSIHTSGDWTYTLTEEGEAGIVSYTGSDTAVIIDTIDGYPVAAIGSGAFRNNTTLTSVTLPDTLLGIYKNAFEGTTALSSIAIPDSVTVIDEYAFRGSGISAVELGENSSLTVLGRYAFADTANLTAFTLPAAVEKIRDYTFSGSGIQTFTLPSDTALTEIGRNAFSGSALTAVELPAGLTKIDYYAFSGCAGLESVVFGTEAELMIYANAFYQTGLTTVDIPANVTYLGEFCFTDCTALEAINVAQDNAWYAGLDGVLYSKDLSRLICCPAGKTGSLTVPDEVASLAFGAFEGSALSEIVISDNSRLSTLGYRAFFRCQNLTEISIPDGLQSIDRYAFAYCPNLTTVHISEGSQLGGIYHSAFYQCPSLTAIYIPAGVQEIDDYAFYDCSSLTDLTLAEDSQLKFIGDYAFQNTAVTELIMPEELYEIGHYAFQNSGLETLVVNETVFWIGDYAFADCGLANTTVLTFPENMEYLGKLALRGVTALEELTVPFLGTTPEHPHELIDLVGDSSSIFSTPETLHTVHVLHGDIAPSAFYYQTNLKTVTLGDDCATIGRSAFRFSGITTLHLPAALSTLGSNALGDCDDLMSVTLAEENPYMEMIDGVLYDEALTKILFAHKGMTGEIVIPETITEIADYTFSDCSDLTGVTLPEGLTHIGYQAFYNCKSLKEITIPDSVSVMEQGAFSGCSSLEKIVVGAGLTKLESSVFSACGTAGCEVTLGANIEVISSGAFSNNGLKTLRIPDSVQTISGYAFSGCKNLESITFGEAVTTIGVYAFYNCSKLTDISLPDSLLKLGGNAFNGSGLTSIWIPKNVQTIEEGALSGCTALEMIQVDPENPAYSSYDNCLYNAQKTVILSVPARITGTVQIPEGVRKLGDYVFSGCALVEEIVLPETVTEIGSCCFLNCTALERMNLPDSLAVLGSAAFCRCTNLKEITLPDNLPSIGGRCFAECSSLVSVTLPEGITQIPYETFYKCKSLANISIGPNITKIESGVFTGTAFTNDESNWEDGVLYLDYICVAGKADQNEIVRIKDGTRLIAANAFQDSRPGIQKCIRAMILPDSLEHIGSAAFYNNSNLAFIRMSKNIETIGSQAFEGCKQLRSIHLPERIQNVNGFMGNVAGYSFTELNTVLIEGAACMESLKLTGAPALNTLIVPYSDATNASKLLNISSSSSKVTLKKLVVTGSHVSASMLYGLDSSTAVYCQVPEGYFTYSGSNTIYYDGEWHLAAFWSDGALVQTAPYAIGAVVEVPSAETMELFALGDDTFVGWDINGDGAADQIPATLSSDLVAEAVWTHTHTEVVDPAVDATCTTNGLTEGSHCSECGAVIVAQEVIPMIDHDYQSVITAPTCTEQGYTTHTCTVCGDSYVSDFVEAGHSYEDGVCTRCGALESAEGPRIVSQPVDYVGAVNDNVSFVVEATGADLTYEWFYSNNGTTWVKSYSPGYSTNTLSPILRAYRDGYRFYCKVTDKYGNSVVSDVVSMTVKASEIVIVTQPAGVENAVLGQLYYYTVTATGDNLEYRWQVSTDGGVTWSESWNQGYNTATLGVRMNANRDGNLYRCVITSGLKTVAVSEPAFLDLQDPSAVILSQSGNVSVIANETATFTVEAEGTDLTYLWYRSNDKGATWVQTYLSGYNTDTLSFAGTTARAAMYMCKVTDGSGKAVWSEPVKLQILSAELKILTQPVNVICAEGGTAAFTVEAQGDTLKYQWYASTDGGTTWTASYLAGYNTNTLSFAVNTTRAARLYKCVITDIAGNTVETEAVSVTIG